MVSVRGRPYTLLLETSRAVNAMRVRPSLSNLYMRRIVLGWKVLGHEQRLDAHIVKYADDNVICSRSSAAKALSVMTEIEMMSKLKLTVNEAKTHVCQVPEETFVFLGYTFGECYYREH